LRIRNLTGRYGEGKFIWGGADVIVSRSNDMAVITISRRMGSYGEEIAKHLSEVLGYSYIDKDVLEQLLTGHGISGEDFTRYDEKRASLWGGLSSFQKFYANVLKLALFESARKGNAVIVGRGGQVLLRGLPGVMHLQVNAPWDVRIERVQAESSVDVRTAERMLHRSDHDREGFLKSFFNRSWNDPELYDLIINTGKITPDSIASMVKDALTQLDTDANRRATEERLDDLVVTQKVENVLLFSLEVDVANLTVYTAKGVVTLVGLVRENSEKEKCLKAVRTIDGVREITDELTVYRLSSA
jgi:cytidylate kinase